MESAQADNNPYRALSPAYDPTNSGVVSGFKSGNLGQSYQSRQQKSSGGGAFKFLLLIIGLAVIATAAFFISTILNSSAKIKARLVVIEPAFSTYTQTIGNVGDYITNDSSTISVEAMERDLKKGQDLYTKAMEDRSALKATLTDTNIAAVVDPLKTNIQAYITQSEDILAMLDEMNKLGNPYIEIYRDYNQLQTDATAIGGYMTTDPDTYVVELQTIIDRENAMIDKLNQMSVPDQYRDFHKAFVNSMKYEVEFMDETKATVILQDNQALNDAKVKFSMNIRQAQSDLELATDEINTAGESLADKLTQQKNDIDIEITRLRNKYSYFE